MNSNLRPFAFLAAALFTAVAGWAQPAGLDVNVRSAIEPPPKKKNAKAGELKKFGIFPATEVGSLEKMVRPLSPDAVNEVYAIVQEKLTAAGYVGVQPKERPEIVITIRYGRGFLANPWSTGPIKAQDGQGAVALTLDPRGGASSGSPFQASAPQTSASGLPSESQFVPGLEAKRQTAAQEKLFVTVEAFEFESMQKGNKPVKLWSTTMNVDDPDHRDLNQVYKQMLVAGGDYFGKKTKEPEVEVATMVREGRVEIGTPKVVPGEPKPAAK